MDNTNIVRKFGLDTSRVEKLIDIFNKNRAFELQLLAGTIDEDKFIELNRELGFVISDDIDEKKKLIEGVKNRPKYEDETEEEFKGRVINMLKEMGINYMNMKKVLQ